MYVLRALRIAGWTLGGIAALAGGVWLLGFSTLTQVHEVRVVGGVHATEAQVRHLADIAEGTPLVAVDLDRAVAGVARHPWVARADASRVFPDTVVVRVREREVRALLVLDQVYAVDGEGHPFRRASGEDLDHVALTGLDPDLARREPELARRILRDALQIADDAVATGQLRESDLSEVHFDARSGYTLHLRNGGEVLLGFRGRSGLGRLAQLASTGLDLSSPHRIDLGVNRLAVVSPL